MEIAASLSISRIWRLALAGVFAAFAWILLSLLLGSAPAAHAQSEGTDDKSLTGAVTSLVDSTTSTVTEAVSAVASEVTDAVDTVVSVAPAPVQQHVRPAVQSAGAVVSRTVEPVTDAVSTGVVTTVAQPVVEVVEQVPVVGEVVSAVGIDDALTDLGATADRALEDAVGAVAATGAALSSGSPESELPGLPWPGLPGSPAVPADSPIPVGGLPLPAPDAVLSAAVIRGAASFLVSSVAASERRFAIAISPAATVSSDAHGSHTPAGALCPPSALSSGPGGAGSGAWGLVALGPLVALRAWVRRAGPEDEHAPPAPFESTDVSPD